MRKIIDLKTNDDYTLEVTFSEGEIKKYDVKPILNCGADLSADTLYIDGVSK